MKIYELDRKLTLQNYGDDYKKAIAAGGFLLWDDERIKSAFNFGNGTKKHFNEYIKDNLIYARFYDADAGEYITKV